jgi:predicted  nucleic acid-binding Zn-ribbon protein
VGPPAKVRQYMDFKLHESYEMEKVKEQLEHLIELQQFDLQILEKKNKIGKIPSQIVREELPLKEALTELEVVKQQYVNLEKKRRDKEREIDDINEKINKIKKRITEIKTNKEYQAHLKEIESAEKERYAVEDEILALMEEIEAASQVISLKDLKSREKKKEIEELKKKLEGEVAEAEKELLPLQEKRSKLVTTIENYVYNEYIKLMESCQGIAVTEAKDEVCQGCHMNIPPQLFVEIKKNEEIINCPQCRRILYFRSDE